MESSQKCCQYWGYKLQRWGKPGTGPEWWYERKFLCYSAIGIVSGCDTTDGIYLFKNKQKAVVSVRCGKGVKKFKVTLKK